MKLVIKSVNKDGQLLTLDILDFVVDKGKTPVHTQLASKEFITNLVSLIKSKDIPEVQNKVLGLIEKWGIKFESQKDILPNFFETYKTFKSLNVSFPENFRLLCKSDQAILNILAHLSPLNTLAL